MESLLNLFVVYVGGKTPTSLIEVHDIHFAIGETIEETYDQLRQQWWGTPGSLHLDAWGMVKNVDGFDIILKNEPVKVKENKLFFLNLGGYNPNEFTELHKNMFVVAADEGEAKIKAKKTISDWQVPHKDYLYAMDDCINVNEFLNKKGISIHLQENPNPVPFEFTCKYVPISKK